MIEDLKDILLKETNQALQQNIVDDLLLLKFYITKCVDIEKGVNKISEKYGWNK